VIVGVDYASVDGNAPPDWDVFQAACSSSGSSAGIAIFRGAYGASPDATVLRDWRRAQAAGLVTGAYLFLRSSQPVVDQVHAFADNVGVLTARDLVPILDVEDQWPGGPEAELEAVHEAWTAMKGIYGAPPMIYDSGRVWLEDLHSLPAGEMLDSAQWVAKPWPWAVHKPAMLSPGPFQGTTYDPVVPAPWGPGNWWLHQYQGDAHPVPGFTNTVDLSRFHLMQYGETGARVRWVQTRLGMPVTGIFDSAMGTRVRAFQTAHGLVADAVIGPRTFVLIAWATPITSSPRAA